jgi:large subunit ribosomal protein L28
MSKVCIITGVSGLTKGGYSNRVRATKFNPTGKYRAKANLQTKKIFIPELGGSVRMTVSTRALRTMKKNGVTETLRKAGVLSGN